MTQDEIICMAREAGCVKEGWLEVNAEFLSRFAALVAQREREACARVCDDLHDDWRFGDSDDANSGPKQCAKAIRDRGEVQG